MPGDFVVLGALVGSGAEIGAGEYGGGRMAVRDAGQECAADLRVGGKLGVARVFWKSGGGEEPVAGAGMGAALDGGRGGGSPGGLDVYVGDFAGGGDGEVAWGGELCADSWRGGCDVAGAECGCAAEWGAWGDGWGAVFSKSGGA
jgi:hypothetical protein